MRAIMTKTTLSGAEVPTFNTLGRFVQTVTDTVTSIGPKETAVIVRKVLKAAFPDVTFSVKTGRGSMVSSVDLRWTDGPTVREVDALLWPFKAGNFDGMTDSFEYGKSRRVIVDGVLYEPCCQYVMTSREISPALANRCIARLVAYWGGIDKPPVALPSRYGSGYELAEHGATVYNGSSIGDAMIREDVCQRRWEYNYTWSSQIHQCISDPARFVRSVESCLIESARDARLAAQARLIAAGAMTEATESIARIEAMPKGTDETAIDRPRLSLVR